MAFAPLSVLLQKYRLVVEHTSNMVVITDAQRRIEYVNPAYTRVTGWRLDEVLGRRPSELLHGPLTDQDTVRRLRSWLDQGQPVVFTELPVFKLWDLHDKPTMMLGIDLLTQFTTVALDFGRSAVRFDIA